MVYDWHLNPKSRPVLPSADTDELRLKHAAEEQRASSCVDDAQADRSPEELVCNGDQEEDMRLDDTCAHGHGAFQKRVLREAGTSLV